MTDAQKRKAIYDRIEKIKRGQSEKFNPKSKRTSASLSILDIFN